MVEMFHFHNPQLQSSLWYPHTPPSGTQSHPSLWYPSHTPPSGTLVIPLGGTVEPPSSEYIIRHLIPTLFSQHLINNLKI